MGKELDRDYAPEQVQAIIESCRSNVLILTGGPGTGKTTTVRAAKGNKNKIKRIEDGEYVFEIKMDAEIYNDWICGIFTKTICEARNRNQLLKAKKMAEELGMEEGKDFFLIKDNCLTELEPEEVDENGVGRTLTCIGFRPLPDDMAHEISRKFQLYR